MLRCRIILAPLMSVARNCARAIRLHSPALAIGASLCLTSPILSQAAPLRASAIVVDTVSGRTLYAQDPNGLRYPASLTKMMTLYLLFEDLERGKVKLTSEFTASAHAQRQIPSKLGLRPGQKIQVEDAILAIVTKSANDVAVTIAENLGGSEPEFAKRMTRTAHSLGMKSTVFYNASGVPNPRQHTTARDMAILGSALQTRFPRYFAYFKTPSFEWNGYTIPSHNHLIGRVEGVDGIKTGYIGASGFNLVTSVHRDGHRLVAVVFGGDTARARDNRMASLIETYIDQSAIAGQGPAFAARKPVKTPVQIAAMPPVKGKSRLSSPVADDPLAPMAIKSVPVPPQWVKGKAALQLASPTGSIGHAKAAELDQGDASDDDDDQTWMIQIGTASSDPGAKALLQKAKAAASVILADADPVTERVKSKVFRARFGGFETQQDAEKACSTLTKRSISCFAVKS